MTPNPITSTYLAGRNPSPLTKHLLGSPTTRLGGRARTISSMGVVGLFLLLCYVPQVQALEFLPEADGQILIPIKITQPNTAWFILDGYAVYSHGHKDSVPDQPVYMPFRPKFYGDLVHSVVIPNLTKDQYWQYLAMFTVAQSRGKKGLPTTPDEEAKVLSELNAEYQRLSSKTDKPFKNKTQYIVAHNELYEDPPKLGVAGESRSFTNRHKWSATSIQAGFGFLPQKGAILPGAHLTLFPTRLWRVSERAAWVDNLSLDLGILGQDDEFMSSDYAMTVGIGYTMGRAEAGSFIHFTAGVARYDDLQGDGKNTFFCAANIDLGAIISAVAK